MDQSRRMVPSFKIGDSVMAVDPVRTSKWYPVYTGPHSIGAVHNGGTYTLLDALSQEMTPRRTADMLRLVTSLSSMEVPSGEGGEKPTIANLPGLTAEMEEKVEEEPEKKLISPSYEIEKVLDQRIHRGKQEYLVHWKGYPEDEATWEPLEHFNELAVINRFWKTQMKRKKEETPAQQPRRSTRPAVKRH